MENLGVEFRSNPRGCDLGSQPAAQASFAFCVAFLSLRTRVSLAGAVDGGGTEGAVGDASGEGNREGPTTGPGAGRPEVGSLPKAGPECVPL
jgi:hypothetical protein